METPPFPSTDELLAKNAAFSEEFAEADLASPPRRSLAVVACMDARMDIHKILGLENGEAHIIRNAGGIISDDVIRSLCLSQRALGTKEIVLMHHTKCGVCGLDENQFAADMQADLGVKPPWPLASFEDPYDDVRQAMNRLKLSPFVPNTEDVRGFVYDVDTGLLDEVG